MSRNLFQEQVVDLMRKGDYMQLDFNGTAIYVFGAHRANHGLYGRPVQIKSPGVALPYTAQRPGMMSNSSSQLSTPTGRIQRLGRETDMGPLSAHAEDEEDERSREMLPPDYQQATEPLPGQRPV